MATSGSLHDPESRKSTLIKKNHITIELDNKHSHTDSFKHFDFTKTNSWKDLNFHTNVKGSVSLERLTLKFTCVNT